MYPTSIKERAQCVHVARFGADRHVPTTGSSSVEVILLLRSEHKVLRTMCYFELMETVYSVYSVINYQIFSRKIYFPVEIVNIYMFCNVKRPL